MRNACLCILSFILAGLVAVESLAADFDKQIEGHWKIVSIEKAGKKLPNELVTKLPGVYVFEGGKLRAMLGDKVITEGDFIVNTKTTPKSFEFINAKDRQGRDIVQRGIYEINAQGQLRQCYTSGRDAVAPQSFDTTQTPGSDTMTYERVK